MPYTYEFPRPALTVDIVVFALQGGHLQVMLVRRDMKTLAGAWALPGGWVRVDETLEDAARRELQAGTGLTDVFLEQLYTFGDLDRDRCERVVTVAYYALVNLTGQVVQAGSDTDDTAWFPIHEPPEMAFYHDGILNMAYERLRGKVRYQPIGFELLPDKFSLGQLQHVYEVILDRKLDKRNFRKKVLSMEFFVALNEIEKDVSHRAAQLYRFDKRKYERLAKKGFQFEI